MRGGKPLHGARQNVMNGGFSGRNRETALLHIVPAVFEILIERRESLHQRPRQFIQKLALESDFDPGSPSFQ